MKTKLEKKVEEIRERKAKEVQSVLSENENEVTLLLPSHQKELETLRKLGLDHNIREVAKIKDSVTFNGILNEKYNKPALSYSELEEMALKYDLNIFRVDQYKGEVPLEIANQITEFCETHDMIIARNYFYLLTGSRKNLKNKNAMLMYLVDSDNSSSSYRDNLYENDKFIPIYTWGKDYTFLQEFKWMFSPRGEAVITIGALVLLIGSIALNLFSALGVTIPVALPLLAGILLYINKRGYLITKSKQIQKQR